MGSLRLHRMQIVLETLAALIGRLTSYTLYLCFGIFSLASRGPEQMDDWTGYRLNIYRSQSFDGIKLGIGLLCLTLTMSAFAVYLVVLPIVWLDETEAQPADSEVAAQVPESPAAPAPTPFGNIYSGGERSGSVIATQSPARRRYTSWIQGEGSSAHLQYHLLSCFIRDNQSVFVSLSCFVIHLSVMLVSAAHEAYDVRTRAC
mmetsp:Transcript_15956/g.43769  ORF Transcript_15956/g.43769 Transcript_15956/m.43769 type:complete len:203 (-) Transcript_15956:217-825(-)